MYSKEIIYALWRILISANNLNSCFTLMLLCHNVLCYYFLLAGHQVKNFKTTPRIADNKFSALCVCRHYQVCFAFDVSALLCLSFFSWQANHSWGQVRNTISSTSPVFRSFLFETSICLFQAQQDFTTSSFPAHLELRINIMSLRCCFALAKKFLHESHLLNRPFIKLLLKLNKF